MHCTLHVSRLNQSRLMAMKLMVAPDLKTYLTYSIEFWRLIKSKEKLIPQYDNCMPRRHLYEIFADWPRSPKKRVSCSSLTIMVITVVEFHVRGDKIQYYIFAKMRDITKGCFISFEMEWWRAYKTWAQFSKIILFNCR